MPFDVTQDWVEAHNRRVAKHKKREQDTATYTRSRELHQFQELKADHSDQAPAKFDNQTGVSEVDGQRSGVFRITVTLRISDQRDRDNDGALSTILDCLISAIGRLVQVDSRDQRVYAALLKRKRRSRRADRKD